MGNRTSYNPIITDKDPAFTINPVTRELKNESGKIVLTQFDHNSERFRFTIPREVEGYDMSKCNSVQIHYYIVDAATRRKLKAKVVEIDESDGKDEVGNTIRSILHANFDDDNKYTGKWEFSWLISNEVTGNAGTLNFAIQFCYIEPGTDNVIYRWGTGINNSVTITTNINGEGVIAEQNSDLIAKWNNTINHLVEQHSSHEESVTEIIDDFSGRLDDVENGQTAKLTEIENTAMLNLVSWKNTYEEELLSLIENYITEHEEGGSSVIQIIRHQIATTEEVTNVFYYEDEVPEEYIDTILGSDVITSDGDSIAVEGGENGDA